jgi:hypothetical protein
MRPRCHSGRDSTKRRNSPLLTGVTRIEKASTGTGAARESPAIALASVPAGTVT